MIGSEVIQVHPAAGKKDIDGGQTYGAPYIIRECIVWPRQSDEIESNGTIIEGFNVYIPPGWPVPSAKDRIRARNKDWDIDGVPGEYIKPDGTQKGALLVLKRVGS